MTGPEQAVSGDVERGGGLGEETKHDGTEVDARGMLCPLPVLRLRKALIPLPPGTMLRMIATDPAAVIDVPHFCEQTGHILVGMRDLVDGAHEFTVKRGEDSFSTAHRSDQDEN